MSNEVTSPPDPFNLEALRAVPDLETVNVQKVLITVPVRRPGKNDFFRVHPSEDFLIDNYVLEHETDQDRTTYWVTPNLRDSLGDHLRKVRLFTCIDKRGNVFLWPAKLPTVDGSRAAQSWYMSALLAAEEAKKVWVKIIGNRAIGAYDIIRARGDLGDPQWPEQTFESLIKIAFRDKLIDSMDHAVIRDLNGEI
jgi:hypothetical protein